MSWNRRICSSAAENGILEYLQYVHENGCPWDEYTCTFAAEYGNIECLQYAYENGCPGIEEYINVIKKNDN